MQLYTKTLKINIPEQYFHFSKLLPGGSGVGKPSQERVKNEVERNESINIDKKTGRGVFLAKTCWNLTFEKMKKIK